MQLTMKHLGGSHEVLVIGDQDDAAEIRARDIQVLGSVDGPVNSSGTLDRRVRNLIENLPSHQQPHRIFAWGWHGATVASGLGIEYNPIAIVDDIDRSCAINSRAMTIIPTCLAGTNMLRSLGVSYESCAEPMIGVMPTSILVDRSTVREMLHIEESEIVVALVGKRMSWIEVIRMAARFHSAGQHVDLVLPVGFLDHSQLVTVAKNQGLSDMLHNPPCQLRHADIINGVDAVWAPDVAEFEGSCEVLDVIETATSGVPLIVSTSHQVSTVPNVGSLIATAKSQIEICGWILSFSEDTTEKQQLANTLKAHVASLTSPSNFIEGLQRRCSSAF
jgi:hypothetical protein